MLIHRTTTDDEVYWQFLRSESYRFRGQQAQAHVASLVTSPDLSDIVQNCWRRKYLFQVRCPLLAQLPDPTEWHIATLQGSDLENLRLIRNCGWDDKATDNVLGRVSYPGAFDEGGQQKIAAILQRVTDSDFDKTLILVAQTTDGPFTILDGNNRATAMIIARRQGHTTDTDFSAYIGVSPRMGACFWCAQIPAK